MGSWGLAQAKAQLSEVVQKAQSDGPQTITRSGREVAMLVSVEEWNKVKKAAKPKGSLADFFLNSPLRGSGIKIEKLGGKARTAEL